MESPAPGLPSPSAASRRRWLRQAAGGLAVLPLARFQDPPHRPLKLRFAVKIGMTPGDLSLEERFRLVRDCGFDGIELDSPNAWTREEVLAAREASGLPVHGVVDSVHWNQRLSHPDPEVRAKGVAALRTAIEDAAAYGGDSVLLVPGRVTGPEETQEHVWERSIEGIRSVLPLARENAVRILIENVWNGFCYRHDGPSDQGAELLRDYIDAIPARAEDRDLVGSYFDIGNHRRYGRPEEWILTLGRRIGKLDVKDWGREQGWARIGEGDVDWPRVRESLAAAGLPAGTWATAEVAGGGRDRLLDIHARMERVLRP